MYKPPQQQSKSRIPTTAPKTSSSQQAQGGFLVQPKGIETTGKQQDAPKYSQEAADHIMAKMLGATVQTSPQPDVEGLGLGKRIIQAPAVVDTLPIQAKLTVGAPGDRYELEADRMASQVMSMSNTALQRQMVPKEQTEEKVQTKSLKKSSTVPGLAENTVIQVEAFIKANQYQQAIDAIVSDQAKAGRINMSFLDGGAIYYNSSLAGEGQVNPPGYTGTGKKQKANPSRVEIGSTAFVNGVSLLYSSMMHEYQHVLQFQVSGTSPSKVPGQGSNPGLIHQQEVEAYSWEAIHSKQTGMYSKPTEMQEIWRRLHDEHWVHLSATEKKPLIDIVKRAYKVAQNAVGKKVTLTFNP